jgi:hypothetical protein
MPFTLWQDIHSIAESVKSLAQSAHVVAQSYKVWVEFVTDKFVGVSTVVNKPTSPEPSEGEQK